MSPISFRHRARRGLIVAGLLIATVVMLPSAAQGAEYSVPYCRDSGGQPTLSNPPRVLHDWVVNTERTAPSGYAYEKCAAGGDPLTIDWSVPTTRDLGDATGWILRPGPGLQISGWQAEASGSVAATDTGLWLEVLGLRRWPVPATSAACGQPFLWKETGTPANVASPPPIDCTSLPLTVKDLTQTPTALEFYLECQAKYAPESATCTGPAAGRLARNVVTFRDIVAPRDAGTTGPLFGSGFGAPLRGTVSVNAAASDVGAGVQRVSVEIDGNVVAESPNQCVAPYDRMMPCPPQLVAELPVDTTRVPDGTRALQVVATDASGERAVLRSGPVVIGNGPNVGPGSDENVRGAVNGTYAADDANLAAWWPATGRRPSATGATKKRCAKSAAYRRAHKTACLGVAPGRAITVSYSAKKQNIVRGTLKAPNGAPVVGGTVQIVQAPKATGLQTSVVAAPRTDSQGRFEARIPAASGSATFAVNWLARAGDTVPAKSVPLQRRVRAQTTFGVSPKNAVRRGKVITFRGTLRGKAGTAKGSAVLIQANAGSAWRAVKTVRADDAGRWRARYRVPSQLRGRYRFRAVVTPSAAYPYGTGRSGSRRITVR